MDDNMETSMSINSAKFWQILVNYLDIRTLRQVFATCKFLNTLCFQSLHESPSNFPIQRVLFRTYFDSKYANLTAMRIKFCGDRLVLRELKLTSLNVTYDGEFSVHYLTKLTALTFCARIVSLSLPCSLRRLEIGPPIKPLSTADHFYVHRLTNLTYLKSAALFTFGFEYLPLIEMDVTYIYQDIPGECMTSLTKLILRSSSMDFTRSIPNLIELAYIDCKSHSAMKINHMTTLTSVTLIDSCVDVSGTFLREFYMQRYTYKLRKLNIHL